ncbi:hypothetical protein [Tuwongella immobilis]|uniref:Uncharacterized protein n=1 Tax=Tuwongella immobilis TaxID=692036 RepID=A0A6C2YRN8_9BACT|nr:hypothetical protein [Tuwongella immobilis]VIP03994.1 Uncharacterized protein OS=Planctomyces limnophilus (strain ATCC 43296 / DSM 3776 / IFAM 1008 / 290) GN=Plim_1877 PE=4 SV=1 [Tuwongella immobilis]VTS05355.1 Uncharacterized protein OS=Planctomyces limnophilus (strain ATCC 43296 / DSM 3776 / IFAM 1008 / 290) GN=Plim_1877 PE=4 SV=1 [Tuwongella immobilis]
MNHDLRQLVNGYLDGVLTEEQEGELNAWVKAAPENAAAFADMVRFHDRLHNVMRIQTTNATPNEPQANPAPTREARLRRYWRRGALVSGLVALAAVVFVAVWSSNPPQASAATELDRLIERADEGRDRSYRIRTLDAAPEQPGERRPPIDEATLHVRQPDQYVLVRKFPDGRLFVTGSDGEKSWSVPPVGAGAVRVSGDPLRFRGPVPGHQHGVPFADLRSDLVQLRDAYVVSPLGQDAAGNRGLLAVKKSAAYRGPNRVELWYDAATGVIHRMVFAGMPKARGGPDSVAIELLEQRELGNDFFRHPAHHAADRRVIEED